MKRNTASLVIRKMLIKITKELGEAKDVLIKLIVLIISQYTHRSNHHAVNLKLTQCSLSTLS